MAQKLYTEEQVKEMINDVGGGFVWYYDIIKKHTPIELPSDKEIIKGYDPREYEFISFFAGATWVKEQILNQNK